MTEARAVRLQTPSPQIMKTRMAFWLSSRAFALMVLAAFSLSLGGCLTTMGKREKESAQQWVGRQFRVRTDLYVFKGNVVDVVYIGANFGKATNLPEFPEEVSEKNIGKETLNSRIIGVVRSGAIFTVRKVVYTRPGGARSFTLAGDVSGGGADFKDVHTAFLQEDWYVESSADIVLLPQLLEAVK